MELQDTIYIKDYTTKNRFTITGNFPVTISGKINCFDPVALKRELELKEHILSEKIDTIQSSTLNYIVSVSSMEFIDALGILYYEPVSLKCFPQLETLPDNTTISVVSDLMYF